LPGLLLAAVNHYWRQAVILAACAVAGIYIVMVLTLSREHRRTALVLLVAEGMGFGGDLLAISLPEQYRHS
jgi:ABC-type cobalamin transport system permease subunit